MPGFKEAWRWMRRVQVAIPPAGGGTGETRRRWIIVNLRLLACWRVDLTCRYASLALARTHLRSNQCHDAQEIASVVTSADRSTGISESESTLGSVRRITATTS